MAKRPFQKSLTDHCMNRSLCFERSWRTISAGSLHIKRIWLFYSVVKEHPTVFVSLWKSIIWNNRLS